MDVVLSLKYYRFIDNNIIYIFFYLSIFVKGFFVGIVLLLLYWIFLFFLRYFFVFIFSLLVFLSLTFVYFLFFAFCILSCKIQAIP